MNFKEAASDLESLEKELLNILDNLSQVAVDKGKTRCTTWGIEVYRRIRRHRRIPGELARDARLSVEEEIARVMNSVIDRLQPEISILFLRLQKLNTKFGFLLDVKTLVAEINLVTLLQNCLDIGNFYDIVVHGHE